MINVLLFELGSVVFFFSRRQTEISLFVLPDYWIYVHLNFIALNAKFVENNKLNDINYQQTLQSHNSKH